MTSSRWRFDAAAVLCALACAALATACSGSDNGGANDTVAAGDASDASDATAAVDGQTDARADTGPDATRDTTTDTGPSDVDNDVIVAGGFRAPCVENSDCNSGWCIDTDEGSVCTRTCDLECPLDWRCKGVTSSGTDVVFLCLPDQSRLCLPCTVDFQCSGGFCLDLADRPACSRPCSDVDPCSAGFACELTTSPEDATRMEMQCVPQSGRCDCTAANAGVERPCPAENEFGRCWGTETCGGDDGWSMCDATPPGPELCDGIDNDCNGVADEDLVEPEDTCATTNDFGTCLGRWSCGGTNGWQCMAAAPSEEVCDFADNDCDGQIDDGFRDPATNLYVDDAHCGVCGNSCEGAIAFATATACAVVDGAATCIATTCEAGYFIPSQSQKACVPLGGGFECSACLGDLNCGDLTDGACELLDGSLHCTMGCAGAGDCSDGFLCDGGRCVPPSGSCSCLASNDGNTRTCQRSNAAGTCFGLQTCDATGQGWSDCLAPEPAEEVCDGIDNDCDGLIDENLAHDPVGCEVTNTFGTCSAPWVCRGDQGWVCEAATPSEEVCDFVDNDCDDLVDDGFRDVASGQYLADDHCGACNISCDGALPNATAACALTDSGGARCEVASCADGFFQQGPLACLPADTDSCLPCETDANCPGAACVTLDDGDFCLNPCVDDSNCLDGYSCVAQGDGSVCRPDTDSCLCDGSNTALLRGCAETFEPAGGPAYDCLGIQMCTASGWGSCGLGEEECNLIDDDCDGEVDEDFLVDGTFASDEHCGQCGNNCTLLVFDGGGGICNTNVSPPICSLECAGNCFDLNANPTDGCECCDPTPTDFPDDSGFDANCDGIDGEKDNAIFVAKYGDDANSGAFNAPKRSVQAGIDAAVAQGKRDVYVATGVYSEAVLLAPAVGVYGGYSSTFALRDSTLFEAALLAPTPTADLPGGVNVIGITGGAVGATVFDGFAVFGHQVKAPGASSYAIYIRDTDSSLRLRRNTITAGGGGKGLRGTDGEDGDDGNSGAPGVDAFDLLATLGVDEHECAAQGIESPGGAGAVGMCGTVETSGGGGGLRVCPALNEDTGNTLLPTAEEWGAPGASGAAGGAPGQDVFHQAFQCLGFDTFGSVEGRGGENGTDGDDGDPGDGCTDATGRVVDGYWVGAVGSGGSVGAPGAGGGGGGSGGGAFVHTSCFSKGFGYDNMGGTGGGAGAGACAGTPGQPGTTGGGAFGIFVTYSAAPASVPEIRDNEIANGTGGDGGDGGSAGVGGSGGAGGFGGDGGGVFEPADPTYPAFEGGKGGKGGNGGHGGGGGGGCGGPAFGIYVDGAPLATVPWATQNTVTNLGAGGAGGVGGFSVGEAGGDGGPGAAAATNLP